MKKLVAIILPLFAIGAYNCYVQKGLGGKSTRKKSHNFFISKSLQYYWTLSYMNMKQTFIKTFVLIAISLSLTACEKDADNDIDMQSFATLNMMNEQNGKNYLDKTDIFIDNVNNFSSKFWYIADLDTKKDDTRGGTPFDMTNIGHLFAVQYDHWYEAYNPDDLRKFPSGKTAIEMGATFYKFYASEAIQENGLNKGAVVKYSKYTATSDVLPPFNTFIGTLEGYDTMEYTLPDGVEYTRFNDKKIKMSENDGKLKIETQNCPNGDYAIDLRIGSVYTTIVFQVR